MRAVDVTVSGLVQGVFFRARAADQAAGLGVTGWVINQPDGTVAGHFEGPHDAVEAMVAWCHEGSERARVERVDVRESEPKGLTGFEAG
jgi:acylphosphatase